MAAVNCLPLSVRTSKGTPYRHIGAVKVDPHRAGWARPRGGDHDAPGVVLDAGDHLALGPAGQRDSADEIHLSQVHGSLTLPPAVRARMLRLLDTDQAVARQHPVDGGLRRRRLQPASGAFVGEPAAIPPRMPATQPADLGFKLGGQARGGVP